MYKQVIAVRTDLGMSSGKIASQVAHASIKAWKNAGRDPIESWEEGGSKKVVVKVGSEEELLELKETADRKGIPTGLVKDSGKTEIPSGTVTCLALGPAPEEELDELTGDLTLLE